MDSNVCQVIDNITGISGSCEYDGKMLEMIGEHVNPTNSTSIEAAVGTTNPQTALQNNHQAIEKNITQCNNQNAEKITNNPSIISESSISTNNNANIINNNNNSFNSNAINPAPTNTINRPSLPTNQPHKNPKQQERNRIMEATTLNEQHKFVKFSLPTNSMNLIQSSTPFINKSKHLFNLITEKSTNIMERTLLPQYLVMRNDLNDKKRLEYSAVAASNTICNGDNKAQEALDKSSSDAILDQTMIKDVAPEHLLNHSKKESSEIDGLLDLNNQAIMNDCGNIDGDVGERLDNSENGARSDEGKYERSVDEESYKRKLVDGDKNDVSNVRCENRVTFAAFEHESAIAACKHEVTIAASKHETTIAASKHKATVAASNPESAIAASKHEATIAASPHKTAIDASTHEAPIAESSYGASGTTSAHESAMAAYKNAAVTTVGVTNLAAISEAKNAASLNGAKHAATIAEVKNAATIVEAKNAAVISDVGIAAAIAEAKNSAEIAEVKNAAAIAEAQNAAAEIGDAKNAAEIAEAQNAEIPTDVKNTPAAIVKDLIAAIPADVKNAAAAVAEAQDAMIAAGVKYAAAAIGEAKNAAKIAKAQNAEIPNDVKNAAAAIAESKDAAEITELQNAAAIAKALNATALPADVRNAAAAVAEAKNAAAIAKVKNAAAIDEAQKAMIAAGVKYATAAIGEAKNAEIPTDVKNAAAAIAGAKNVAEITELQNAAAIAKALNASIPADVKNAAAAIAEAKNAASADETDFINTKSTSQPKNNPASPPNYQYLIDECRKLKDEKTILETQLKALEEKNMIQTINNSDVIANTIDDRDKTIERLTNELRAALFYQDEMRKELAAATREKESMVMKYAVSEKQLIDSQKAKSVAERRLKELQRDYELIEGKWKHGQGERMKISSILDSKCRELVEVQKELDKSKEELDVRDVKLKWTQTKLKSEMEMHKETHEKLEKALGQVNQMKDEFEKIRRDSQDMIKRFQQSEENKAVSLDQQLKEQQAKLILERYVIEDKEMLRLQLVREVEMLNNRQHILMEENNALTLKIEELEQSKVNYEKNLSDLKTVADQRQKEILELTDKLCHLETLKLDLINKQQTLASMQAELERLRLVNKELQVDMDCCLQRETNMLEFTQKLTDKNVKLQSEFSAIEAKASKLETEQGPLHETIAQLKAKMKTLQENLTSERSKRIEECEILAKHVAEQTQLAQNLTQMLEDSRGENSVLKRKHQVSLKELTRELHQLRKKLEVYEAKGVSQGNISRAASNTSLNAADGATVNGSSTADSTANSNEILSYNNLDKAALIDRIVKMQRINVKRAEKLDFLEEHTRALVAELQKKTKIIQNYILTENFDAMGSNERDKYKAELIKHGGIMASVYHQRVSDDNMTLELSLEINQKLQTVLEDALLKNITLKDNIDTLGEEIARLTIQNQQRASK